jgi:hypothetical protein
MRANDTVYLSPKLFSSHRSPLATTLTDHLLDAFATTDNTQTTASIDGFLGAFGLTDNLEEQMQRLDAEPANVRNHRILTTFATSFSVLQNSGALRLLD